MDTSPAIWPPHEAFYIESMLFHTRQACSSIEFLVALIDHIRSSHEASSIPEFDCSVALDHVQNTLFRAAAISRYFWPSRSAHNSRGEYLRKAFGVEDTSPLRNRDLRDAAEHFDERLDNYLKNGIVGCIIPEWFGPTRDREVPTHFFRAYFIDRGYMRILNQEFFVQPIADEVVRVHNLLTGFHANGCVVSRVGT